jgi:hypothetical protein
VKRLFSILLMNAWGGLRHMPGLSTAVMVLVCAMALVVAGNVTAGASPDSTLSSKQNTLHSANHHSSASSQMFAFFGADSPDLHTKKKAPESTDQDKSKPATSQPQDSNTAPTNNSSSPKSEGTQPTASLSFAMAQPVCEQGQMMYGVESAQLSFQTPTAANGTATWVWETQQLDSTTNTYGTTSSAGGSSGSQPITAGVSKVTLTASDSSQPWFSTYANSNYSYRFRLHVTGPIDVTSAWVNVPAASSCTPS